MRRLLLTAAVALALAAPAQALVLLGIAGNAPRFQTLTGQVSNVQQAFLGWGQGLSYGSPFSALFATLTPIPMIHLGTSARPPGRHEAITPHAIAMGAGDGYLIALNNAIAVWAKGIYVRPMAEMNNCLNLFAGFTCSGSGKALHSPADYRKAFARIYLILHGGTAVAINAKLAALGLPPIQGNLPVNPFPRLRILWSPLAGGPPHIAANDPQLYYPGTMYVDVDGGDIFDEGLVDNAPWSQLEALYAATLRRHKPFSVPEWGPKGFDDAVFVRHMCRFLRTHRITEEAGYYESRPGSAYDIEPLPKARKAYRDCLTPQGARVPAWASGQGGPVVGVVQPIVTFTLGGQPVGQASAPTGANDLETNMDAHTGAIGSAVWTRDGHPVGSITLPRRVDGLVFRTMPGAHANPLTRPPEATDFHVFWNAAGVITSAQWTRVGTLLAAIPVTSGQHAIAFTNGTS